MKKIKKIGMQISILFILVFLVSTSSKINKASVEESFVRHVSRDIIKPNLIEHDVITILNDDNFTDYGFLGNGDETNPYKIENLCIEPESGTGITIRHTTKYFRIKNCYISTLSSGIFVNNVTEGTAEIVDNICIENGYNGIYVTSSNSTVIRNNTCLLNDDGIYVSSSMNSIILDNYCENNIDNGIGLRNSDFSSVDNNLCINNGYGGVNYFGIYLIHSSYTEVVNNELIDNGLFIDDLDLEVRLSYNVEGNKLNDKPIAFFENEDYLVIDNSNYGQLSFTNCSNIVIKNNVLEDVTYNCILSYCNHALIENNTCEILVTYSNKPIIRNNIGIKQTYGAILMGSENAIISNNTYKYCGGGIGVVFSDNSTILNNICNDNNIGILLYSSDNSTIAFNSCNFNKMNGMELEYSQFLNITRNICSYNDECGIYTRCYNSNITYNVFKQNIEYGLSVSAKYCFIHHNTFIDNNLMGESQARGWSNNTWYDPETNEGNYWSDWNGTGVYYIDDYNEFDPYPLSEPLEPTEDIEKSKYDLSILLALFPTIIILILYRKKGKRVKK